MELAYPTQFPTGFNGCAAGHNGGQTALSGPNTKDGQQLVFVMMPVKMLPNASSNGGGPWTPTGTPPGPAGFADGSSFGYADGYWGDQLGANTSADQVERGAWNASAAPFTPSAGASKPMDANAASFVPSATAKTLNADAQSFVPSPQNDYRKSKGERSRQNQGGRQHRQRQASNADANGGNSSAVQFPAVASDSPVQREEKKEEKVEEDENSWAARIKRSSREVAANSNQGIQRPGATRQQPRQGQTAAAVRQPVAAATKQTQQRQVPEVGPVIHAGATAAAVDPVFQNSPANQPEKENSNSWAVVKGRRSAAEADQKCQNSPKSDEHAEQRQTGQSSVKQPEKACVMEAPMQSDVNQGEEEKKDGEEEDTWASRAKRGAKVAVSAVKERVAPRPQPQPKLQQRPVSQHKDQSEQVEQQSVHSLQEPEVETTQVTATETREVEEESAETLAKKAQEERITRARRDLEVAAEEVRKTTDLIEKANEELLLKQKDAAKAAEDVKRLEEGGSPVAATEDAKEEEKEKEKDEKAFPTLAWPTLGGPSPKGKKPVGWGRSSSNPSISTQTSASPVATKASTPFGNSSGKLIGAWGKAGGGTKLIKEAAAAKAVDDAKALEVAKAKEAKIATDRSDELRTEAARLSKAAQRAQLILEAAEAGGEEPDFSDEVEDIIADAVEKVTQERRVEGNFESAVSLSTEVEIPAAVEDDVASRKSENDVAEEDEVASRKSENDVVEEDEVASRKSENDVTEEVANDARVENQSKDKVAEDEVASRKSENDVAEEDECASRKSENDVVADEGASCKSENDVVGEVANNARAEELLSKDNLEEDAPTEAADGEPSPEVADTADEDSKAESAQDEDDVAGWEDEMAASGEVKIETTPELALEPAENAEVAAEQAEVAREIVQEQPAKDEEKEESDDEGSEASGWSDDDDWQEDKGAKAVKKEVKVETRRPAPLDPSESSAVEEFDQASDGESSVDDNAKIASVSKPEIEPESVESTPIVEKTDRVAGEICTNLWPSPGPDRFSALLKFRHVTTEMEPPKELATFGTTQDSRTIFPATSPSGDSPTKFHRAQSDGKLDGGRARDSWRSKSDAGLRRSVSLLAPSPTAYKVGGIKSRDADLGRKVQSQLNKIAPDNVLVIAQRIVENKVESSEELSVVIGLIMKKALAEPHYCETYADLVFKLKGDMPEFPGVNGGKPLSFKSILLTVIQDEFESISQDRLALTEEEQNGKDKEELDFMLSKKKAKCLATMKFIGHLYLRSLLSARIIGDVIQEQAGCSDANAVPGDHIVECICELLNSIGYTLESMPAGKEAITQVCGRLLDLKQKKNKKGKPIYPMRINFMIQDLLDTKKNGWERKVFKQTAKTKEEIKNDAMRDEKANRKDGSSVVVAGQRPSWMTAGKDSTPGASEVSGPWQDVPVKSRK